VSTCLNRTTDHTARPVVPDEPGLQSTNCDGHGKCASMRAESDRAPGEVDRSVGPSVLGGCSVWKALSHSSCRFRVREEPAGRPIEASLWVVVYSEAGAGLLRAFGAAGKRSDTNDGPSGQTRTVDGRYGSGNVGWDSVAPFWAAGRATHVHSF